MPKLVRGVHLVTRNDGTTEHAVMLETDPAQHDEPLVHLSITKSGHASVIDYDTHPRCKCDHPPEVIKDKVKRFLEHGGHEWLGLPSNPASRDEQVAKLKARHGLE